MSIDDLSYNRLHPSAFVLSLRLEKYCKYFILSIPLFYHVSEKCRHFYSLSRRSLSPSWRRFHSCTRRPQRRSRCLSPRVAPGPGPVIPAVLSVVTLRSSAVLSNSALLPPNFSSYIENTFSQGSWLKDRRPSRRPFRILSLSVLSWPQTG